MKSFQTQCLKRFLTCHMLNIKVLSKHIFVDNISKNYEKLLNTITSKKQKLWKTFKYNLDILFLNFFRYNIKKLLLIFKEC